MCVCVCICVCVCVKDGWNGGMDETVLCAMLCRLSSGGMNRARNEI